MGKNTQTKIVYKKAPFTTRTAYRTQKFGNILSDTYQGSIDQSDDGTWTGWFMNLSRSGYSDFKIGLRSKRAAIRWVNKKLREVLL